MGTTTLVNHTIPNRVTHSISLVRRLSFCKLSNLFATRDTLFLLTFRYDKPFHYFGRVLTSEAGDCLKFKAMMAFKV